jgi:ribonuclease BN (tRNA processing enzyme)
MKLTITGSGSGKPAPGKNLSSIILEYKQHLLLLDCGEPVARIIAERHLDVDEIETIVITHFHPDHSSGIYMLLQLFEIRKRTRKLRLYLPESIELFQASLAMYYLFMEKFPFILEILPIKRLGETYSWLSIIENDHLQRYRKFISTSDSSNEMCSCSILIRAEQNVLYTSDIESLKPIKTALELADLIIIDALHPSPDDLWGLVRAGKKIVLTHGLHPQLAEKLAADRMANAIIAYDGLEFAL